jgi:hypothetical protein
MILRPGRLCGLVSPLKTGMILLAFFGCTAQRQPIQLVSPQISPPDNGFVVMRDIDTTWNALGRVLDGTEERKVQKENKRAKNITLKPALIVLEDNCDCGRLGDTPLTGTAMRRTYIRLQKRAPQETVLNIVCEYSTIHQWKGLDGKVVRTENIPCISNGRFEREIHQRVLGYMSP